MSVTTLNNRIMQKLLEKGKPFRSVSALHHVGKLMRHYHLGTYDEIANEIALLNKNILEIEGKNRFLKSQSQKDLFSNKQLYELKENFSQNSKDDLQLSKGINIDKKKIEISNYEKGIQKENQNDVKCKNGYKTNFDRFSNNNGKDKNYNFLLKTKQVLQESAKKSNKNYSLYTNQKGQQNQNVGYLYSNRNIKDEELKKLWNENNSHSNIYTRNKSCLYCNGTKDHFDNEHILKQKNDKIYKSTNDLEQHNNILEIQLSPISCKTKQNQFMCSSLPKTKKMCKISLIQYNKGSKSSKITTNDSGSSDRIKQAYQLFKEAEKKNKKSASSSNIVITPLRIPDKEDLKKQNIQEDDLITSPRSEVSDLFSSNRNQLQANLKLLSNIKLKVTNENNTNQNEKEKNSQCKNKKNYNNNNNDTININEEIKNSNIELNSTKRTKIIRCLPCFMGLNKSAKTIQVDLNAQHIHFKKIKKLSNNHQKKDTYDPALIFCNTARADKLIRSYYELM